MIFTNKKQERTQGVKKPETGWQKAQLLSWAAKGLKHKIRRKKEIPTIRENPNCGLFRTKESAKEAWKL